MSNLLVNYENKPCYQISFEKDFSRLKEEIEAIGKTWGRVCIVTDSNVSRLYLDTLQDELIQMDIFRGVFSYTFQAGEENKNLETVQDVYTYLIKNHFDRKDLLIAFGGGVVGDLTGFTAATYLRGIDFIQIPTTLLSQVDSSVGGKTGVDFRGFKNMVGAFYMPKLVYMNMSLLESLPDVQVRSGLGEIIKYGISYDKEFYQWLGEHQSEILNLDPECIVHAVKRSCEIKKAVVEEDPKEQGIRAILNFGHTIGHAVEKLLDFRLTHGECVAIGFCAASYLSVKRGLLTAEEYESILRLTESFGLPTSIPEDLHFSYGASDILEATKSDKKRNGSHIRFILVDGIGTSKITDDVTDDEILDAANSILNV